MNNKLIVFILYMISICFTLIFCNKTNFSPEVLIPKTGQTISVIAHDDGALKKGVSWPVPRFVDNRNGTITDKLTGLMWEKQPIRTKMNWEQSFHRITHLNAISLGGHKDWRLPNILELESLTNISQFDNSAWLIQKGFKGVQNGNYWSSTLLSGSEPINVQWCLDMGTSDLNISMREYGLNVIGVRTAGQGVIKLPRTGQTKSIHRGDDGNMQIGVAHPNPRFIDNGNGTITDKLTGLKWEKSPPIERVFIESSIQERMNKLNRIKLGGFGDWRMPNRKEILSLVNFGQKELASWLNKQGFQKIQRDIYWTSSAISDKFWNNKRKVWCMDMKKGMLGIHFRLDYYILAVRGGS